jgi:hypothetical protein
MKPSKREDNDEAIFSFIKDYDVDTLEEYIENYPNDESLPTKNSEGELLLELLVKLEVSSSILEGVLDRGVDINAKNKAGETAFIIALNSKQFNAIKTFIEYGAKIDAVPARWNKKRYQRAIELFKKYIDIEFVDDDGNSLCPFNWKALEISKLPELGKEMFKNDEIAEFLSILSGGDFLGSGSYGKVYRVDLGPRSYAIKKSELNAPRVKCTTLTKYTAIDETEVKFHHPAIMIHDTSLCEYLIGKVVGSLYNSGDSINFIDVIVGGKVLNTNKEYEWWTMYPRMSGELNDIFEEFYEDDDQPKFDYNYNVDMAIFSIIHALGVAQSKYGIIHNDLSCENVMLEYIRPHKPTFKKDGITYPVHDFDYGTYVVEDKNSKKIYEFDLSKISYIARIVDWGLACKYKHDSEIPAIINKHVQEDDEGYFGNYYSEAIDLVMLIFCIFKYDSSAGMRTPFVTQVAEWVYERIEGDSIDEKIMSEYDSNECSDSSKRNNYRMFKSFFADKTPRNFFKQPFVEKFIRDNSIEKDELSEREMNTITLGKIKWD